MASGSDADDGGRAAAYEALCRHCGICCHHKVRDGAVVVITDVPCEFFDAATCLCTVYPRRFEEQPQCATAETSVMAGTLPDTCPYVGGRSNYRAPLFLRDHPEYEEAINRIFPERVAGKLLKNAAKALGRPKGERDI